MPEAAVLRGISLSARITASALAVVAVGAFVSMYVEEARLRDAYLNERHANLDQVMQTQKLRLTKTVNTLRQDVLFLANTPPIAGIVRAARNHGYDARYGNTTRVWAERLQQIFSAFSASHPDYYQIRYIGVADAGREIVRTDNRGGKTEPTPSGRLQAKGERDYFKAALALREGEVYFSDFNLNREQGVIERPPRPTLRAATPIFTPQGEIFGIVIINMDAAALLQSATEGLMPDVQACIANMDGQYLLHPDARKAFAFELGDQSNIVRDFPAFKTMFDPDTGGHMSWQPGVMAADRPAGNLLTDAERVHFDLAHPERFLLLAYFVPDDTATRELTTIPASQMIGGFFVMLLVGGIAMLVLRRMFAPLKYLTATADRIAAGDYNIRLQPDGGGEIGTLNNAFSAMLTQLSQREHEILRINAGLEARVKERTAELEKAQLEAGALLRRNQALMDTSLDGIHVMDVQGNVLEANDAFCAMLGYRQDEVRHLNAADWDVRSSKEELQAAFRNIIGNSAMIETRQRRKDGALIDVEISASGVEIDGQAFVFAANRDITERKRAEEALRVAAVTFEASDAIMITDANAHILRVNRAFVDITGYGEEEVLGRNTSMMSSGRHNEAFYVEMWQQLLHSGTWSGEIWDRRKNGQIYPKWLSITAIRDGRGETTRYVAIFSDITLRKQAEEEIHNLAFYDPLTHLPNRRLFMDRFRAALAISARRDDYGALLFVDLDRFKVVNDTLGHDSGDLLLVEVANRIKSCVREMDTVARLGGDEFTLLIEGISKDRDDALRKIGMVAEKVRESLSRSYQLKDHLHHSSPSIGISLFRGNEEQVDVLLHHADRAMYQAKESGRNAVRFYDPAAQRE